MSCVEMRWDGMLGGRGVCLLVANCAGGGGLVAEGKKEK